MDKIWALKIFSNDNFNLLNLSENELELTWILCEISSENEISKIEVNENGIDDNFRFGFGLSPPISDSDKNSKLQQKN